jgi:hypothetical protein
MRRCKGCGRCRPSTSPILVGSSTGTVRMWPIVRSSLPDRLLANLEMLNYGHSDTALVGNGATHCGTLRPDPPPATFLMIYDIALGKEYGNNIMGCTSMIISQLIQKLIPLHRNKKCDRMSITVSTLLQAPRGNKFGI